MKQELSLIKIEQKLYLKYFDDGLIEIIYGLIILLFSIGMITDTAWIGGVFGALIISLWVPLKKKKLQNQEWDKSSLVQFEEKK